MPAQPVTTTASHKIPKIQPPITSVAQWTPRYTRETPTRVARIAATAQMATRARHECIRTLHSQAKAPHTAAAAAGGPDGQPYPPAAPPAGASSGLGRASVSFNTMMSRIAPADVADTA